MLPSILEMVYAAADQPQQWPEILSDIDQLMQKRALNHQEITDIHLSLLPHIQRILDINMQIETMENKQASFSLLLDKLPFNIIIVDHTAKPHFINRRAQTFLQSNPFLKIKSGLITTKDPTKSIALHKIIQTITSIQPQNRPRSQSLQLPDNNGEICTLHITSTAQLNIKTATNLAAVFITHSAHPPQVSQAALTDSFHLSTAEIKLLHTLLEHSHSLPEAAKHLAISHHTARNQMKSIFAKTGIHNQNKLIKTILHNPAIMLHQPDPDYSDHHLAQSFTSFHTIPLNSGGSLEYTEFGDPTGTPIIYFHGLIHAREQFHPFSHYAKNHGIRIIAVERPGFGASSLKKHLSLTAYSKDIQQLAAHFSINKYYLLGEGNGAASALACAATMPEALHKVAIISCVTDTEFDDYDNMQPFSHQILQMTKNSIKPLVYILCRNLLKILKRKKTLQWMMKTLHHTDRNIVNSPEYQHMFINVIQRAASIGHDGLIDDYLTRLAPWDFDVHTIKTEVQLWHGEHDHYTSCASAKALAAALPNCTSTFLNDAGHSLFISHIDPILSQLLGQEPSQRIYP